VVATKEEMSTWERGRPGRFSRAAIKELLMDSRQQHAGMTSQSYALYYAVMYQAKD
jgi:hypothetical protein